MLGDHNYLSSRIPTNKSASFAYRRSNRPSIDARPSLFGGPLPAISPRRPPCLRSLSGIPATLRYTAGNSPSNAYRFADEGSVSPIRWRAAVLHHWLEPLINRDNVSSSRGFYTTMRSLAPPDTSLRSITGDPVSGHPHRRSAYILLM